MRHLKEVKLPDNPTEIAEQIKQREAEHLKREEQAGTAPIVVKERKTAASEG